MTGGAAHCTESIAIIGYGNRSSMAHFEALTVRAAGLFERPRAAIAGRTQGASNPMPTFITNRIKC